MFHHGLRPKHLPPPKCIKSILFICSCVHMLRLSSLPADRHFVSTHASLTVVLKPLNRGVRQKSSSFCSPERGGEGECPPPRPALHCSARGTMHFKSAQQVPGEKQMSMKPVIYSFNEYLFIQCQISVRRYTQSRGRNAKEKDMSLLPQSSV